MQTQLVHGLFADLLQIVRFLCVHVMCIMKDECIKQSLCLLG